MNSQDSSPQRDRLVGLVGNGIAGRAVHFELLRFEPFRSKALAGGRVNHPNVVNVFDVIDHDGMICIVMELLEGESFGAYLRRKAYLGIDEAAAVLLPAMRGVAAANAEGVVHRDLKPQNIFICIGSDGRMITSKVLDFGISVMRENWVGSEQVAQLVATHGTPAYMSPEHISRAPDIDARADVYGFGVLFFEALTGRLPFVGDSIPTLLVRILNENPVTMMVLVADPRGSWRRLDAAALMTEWRETHQLALVILPDERSE